MFLARVQGKQKTKEGMICSSRSSTGQLSLAKVCKARLQSSVWHRGVLKNVHIEILQFVGPAVCVCLFSSLFNWWSVGCEITKRGGEYSTLQEKGIERERERGNTLWVRSGSRARFRNIYFPLYGRDSLPGRLRRREHLCAYISLCPRDLNSRVLKVDYNKKKYLVCQ